MINWKALVGEAGLIEFVNPFLMVGQHGPNALPIGVGPQGPAVLGTAPDLQPMVTQFLANVRIVAFDEESGGLTLNYDSPVGSAPGSRATMELHVDAANVLYFVKANQIALVSNFVGADGKPLS